MVLEQLLELLEAPGFFAYINQSVESCKAGGSAEYAKNLYDTGFFNGFTEGVNQGFLVGQESMQNIVYGLAEFGIASFLTNVVMAVRSNRKHPE